MARFQGRLIEWHDEKGYGFIQGITDERHTKVFLHIKSFKRPGPRPIEGCVLEYELGIDDRSRPQAQNVNYVKSKEVQNKTKSRVQNTTPLVFQPIYALMAVYWVTLFVCSFLGLLPSLLILILSVINAYTYWIYSHDKKAAQSNQRRVPEKHLLTVSLLGGWTAAWFAQQNLRHKTQKQPFKSYFKAMIVFNITILCVYLYYLNN